MLEARRRAASALRTIFLTVMAILLLPFAPGVVGGWVFRQAWYPWRLMTTQRHYETIREKTRKIPHRVVVFPDSSQLEILFEDRRHYTAFSLYC